ncbi:MAG: hypothetical protein K9L83_00615 [Deltaproteobacteria bacterium]|nr:hypothetical protein [Deltaproteobacteria bacterium]
MVSFSRQDLMIVSDSLAIAEDATSDFYKFSFRQWKRHGYDVKTLRSLSSDEISSFALAVLKRAEQDADPPALKTRMRHFYFICLQDHLILEAVNRDRRLALLPLLVYIFTHELVHIVRFCNFSQRFELSEAARSEEESVVHARAFDILNRCSIPRLDYVLESYDGHRKCAMAF